MNELADYINRAAPPGSMRYFALLYTPVEYRDLLTALFIVEAEVRASATQVAHEVAHTRMQWWRGEVDRLINRNAQHPATRVLQSSLPNADFALLHELLASADMDLARMTYNTAHELDGYLQRSGGTIFELVARDEDRAPIRVIGGQIRRMETVRDLVLEARAGRIYWPLNDLAAQAIAPERLPEDVNRTKLLPLLANETARLANALSAFTSSATYPLARPLTILTQLHSQLARRIARADHNVFTIRHELGPLKKTWTAWRTARCA
jgi:phytoene synthase